MNESNMTQFIKELDLCEGFFGTSAVIFGVWQTLYGQAEY